MLPRKSLLFMLAFIAWISPACSSVGGPRQIAAAHHLTPIAEYPGDNAIIYQATIELQVGDVDAASVRAEDLAQRYGGYLVSSQSWVADGRNASTLELIVLTANFDHLRAALLQLGNLVNETTNGRRVEPPPARQPYSSITLHLRPAKTPWSPPAPVGRWDPGRTFQRAFGVFLTIFGFLADILIWGLVVAGPFVVIFFIGWQIARRLRR
jgi:hypothetical protein